MPVISADGCAIVAIDVQPGFFASSTMGAEARKGGAATVDRAAWLAGLVGLMGMPIVVVEEGPDRAGPTDSRLLDRVPADTPIVSKTSFSAACSPAAMNAIAATRRRTLVIIGFETDTCIAESAIDLRDLGYRVLVLEDAMYSASEIEHGRGVARLRQDGIETRDCKSLILEWNPDVHDAIGLVKAAAAAFGTAPMRL